MLKIVSMRTKGCVGKIKAYFSVSFGDFIINDLRLIVGANGPFVAFPSRAYKNAAGEQKYAEVVAWSRTAEGSFTDSSQALQLETLTLATSEFERRTGEPLTATAAIAQTEEDDDVPF